MSIRSVIPVPRQRDYGLKLGVLAEIYTGSIPGSATLTY